MTDFYELGNEFSGSLRDWFFYADYLLPKSTLFNAVSHLLS